MWAYTPAARWDGRESDLQSPVVCDNRPRVPYHLATIPKALIVRQGQPADKVLLRCQVIPCELDNLFSARFTGRAHGDHIPFFGFGAATASSVQWVGFHTGSRIA